MRPEAFYEQALALLQEGGDAGLRSAASRAYYSVFHVARANTEDLELAEEPHGSHKKVQERVKHRYGKALARWLRSMSRKRNNADYDLNVDFGAEDVEQIIEMRRLFLEEIAKQSRKRQVRVNMSNMQSS